MNRTDIKQKLHTIYSEILEHDDFVLNDDLMSEEIDGWSSLVQAMVITSIEETFGIKFKLKDLTEWTDMRSLIDIIERKQNETHLS